MTRFFFICLFAPGVIFGQYEDYESYETFDDLDKYQRDFGLIFLPSLMYSSVEEENEVTGATANDRARNLLFYDVRLAYVFRGGFYFGMLYAGETVDINGDSPKNDRQSLGVGFGYLRYGAFFSAHFFPYSKQTLSGTLDVSEYSEGTGFQVDLAYYFRLGKFVSVGPQLVYKSIRYGEAESAVTSQDSDASSTHNVLTPMLSLIFNIYRG